MRYVLTYSGMEHWVQFPNLKKAVEYARTIADARLVPVRIRPMDSENSIITFPQFNLFENEEILD